MLDPQDIQMDTELRILEAAKIVFVQKGMDGAVMQDIADAADISRTALHYYFRSKQKLFDAVLKDLFGRFLPRVEEIMCSDISFREKIERFVHEYLDMFLANPYLPNFVMNELNKNPEKVIQRFTKGGLMSPNMRKRIEEDLRQLHVSLEPAQFVMNLISMCVFPFIAKPLVEEFFANGLDDPFPRFIETRKEIIVDTLMSFIESRIGREVSVS